MLKFYSPVLQNMTLFGNNVIINIINYVKRRSHRTRVGPLSNMTGVLI